MRKAITLIFFQPITVLEEKNAVFPQYLIIVSESIAEVSLQILADRDAKPLFQLLVKSNHPLLKDLPDDVSLELHHKWGIDGSGDHATYQQAFTEALGQAPPTKDRSVLLTAISVLQLRIVREGLPPQVLWKNPTPSSVRFCKPLRLQFKKETDESLKEKERYVLNQIESLESSRVTEVPGKILKVHHKFSMTMIDGKCRNVLTDTASFARCTACNATPNEMKVTTAVHRPVDTSTFMFGLSVLHARIRFFGVRTSQCPEERCQNMGCE